MWGCPDLVTECVEEPPEPCYGVGSIHEGEHSVAIVFLEFVLERLATVGTQLGEAEEVEQRESGVVVRQCSANEPYGTLQVLDVINWCAARPDEVLVHDENGFPLSATYSSLAYFELK